MRNKLFIGSLIITLVGLSIVQQFSYPSTWDEIKIGMSRDEVYSRIGRPGQDWGALKGAFWMEVKLSQTQELWVYFDNDAVTNRSITRRVGTTKHFYVVSD
jgi:outer membrane protein assembly factor BamE (lipoprotein component of BamABCDE complex)